MRHEGWLIVGCFVVGAVLAWLIVSFAIAVHRAEDMVEEPIEGVGQATIEVVTEHSHGVRLQRIETNDGIVCFIATRTSYSGSVAIDCW